MRSLPTLLRESRPLVMGVLNVTPDSFSDGGEHYGQEAALDHASRLIDAGADIIDIGGESTRPAGRAYGAGSEPVSAEEEVARVLPVLSAIRQKHPGICISIDTVKSTVARQAVAAGADVINDVSGGTSDPEILQVASEMNSPLILMHGHGPRFTKASIEEYTYPDVISSVVQFLRERIEVARQTGIECILADVGIGFAKGYQDNLRLLANHDQFRGLGVPLVLGVSRKTTIGRAMGTNPPPKDRLHGSIAAGVYGAEHGAAIVRTHDVKETREALSVLSAILVNRHQEYEVTS